MAKSNRIHQKPGTILGGSDGGTIKYLHTLRERGLGKIFAGYSIQGTTPHRVVDTQVQLRH